VRSREGGEVRKGKWVGTRSASMKGGVRSIGASPSWSRLEERFNQKIPRTHRHLSRGFVGKGREESQEKETSNTEGYRISDGESFYPQQWDNFQLLKCQKA